MSTPIINNPMNPYGIDFSVFGNTGFIITNGNYSGGGITDGSSLGNNPGVTRVEVSADGVSWYTLNPLQTWTVDGLFPTDGLGDSRIPVNPMFAANNFAGLGLAGIRSLYAGSAGGTGFDLAQAQDTDGNGVNLPIARFVRLNVLSGKSEVDAVSTTRGSGAVIAEDFLGNPLQSGWHVCGNTNLFIWNPINQNLEVTWDSSQENTYFYHPLGTTLARDDDFSVAFDLRLDDIGAGLDPAKDSSFPLAIGFLNLAEATGTNFLRGTGRNSPDLAEFAYFWDSGFGATMWPTFVDSKGTFNWNGSTDYALYELNPGEGYHVVMTYAASNQSMVTRMTNFQHTSGVMLIQTFGPNFTDFRADTLSISSYSDAGQDPRYGGSVLAHGTIDNLVVTVPPPPLQSVAGTFTNGFWQAQFIARTNWLYTLERTSDFQFWTEVSPSTPGQGGALILSDPSPATGNAFFRVRANRP
jgi:hypothetical protein